MTPTVDTVREYHLRRCLGKGGFGEVYLAEIKNQGGLSVDAAIKLLHGSLDPNDHAVARLRDEGRLLALVDHPAILRVRDMVVLGGRIALITEYVEGQDLTDCLRDDTDPMPTRALVESVGVVADALHAAWSSTGKDGRTLGIVHRDIKPSNIRISHHGQVKLLDFGIARTDTVTREARTATDAIIGSLPYMAPERYTANDADPRSDVFSLGCVLYEGLTGDLAFDLPVPMMMGLAYREDKFQEHVDRKLLALPKDVPRALRELVRDNYGERVLNISADSIFTGALGAALFAHRGLSRP